MALTTLIKTLQGRLRKLGIPSTRTARNGAWLALGGSVHWKMLADLLGVAVGTASAWHKEVAPTAPATLPPACGDNTSRRTRPDSPEHPVPSLRRGRVGRHGA